MVAAAYYGIEQRWVAAENEWSDALAEAEVDEFHATDFYACRGAFKGWTLNSERHVEAAKRFTRIAATHRLVGFAYGLDVSAFTAIVKPALTGAPKRFRNLSPRLFCMVGCLANITQTLNKHAASISGGEQIAVF